MPFCTVSRECVASVTCVLRHLTAPGLLAGHLKKSDGTTIHKISDWVESTPEDTDDRTSEEKDLLSMVQVSP